MVPKNKYLDSKGLRLHYLDWGKNGKTPMLLLHGFMAHAHAWDEFASGFRDRYHIIALDQRGHGESQWSEDEAYSLDNHFSDIANLVDVLKLKDFILVGHSMGGRNALFYTACHPQNVERLILVDARPANSVEASERLRHDLLHLPLQATSLDEIALAIRALYPSLSFDICHDLASHGYKEEKLGGPFIPKYDARMGFHSDQMGCITEDLWPFMKNVVCPTLIVRGEESPFLSKEDAQKMSGTQGEYGDIGLTPEVHISLARELKKIADEVSQGRFIIVLCGGSRRYLAHYLIPKIIEVLAEVELPAHR
jgi:pimeloyl-ACP methyl ester carboxylesterase